MTTERNAHYAAGLLRISLGVMYLAHGIVLKHFMYTLEGTAQYFASIGLPSWGAYVVFAMETVGGALLVLGIGTRWVTAALLPILFGAVWAHSGNGWVFSAANGGWEYPVYLVVLSVAQILLGDGAWSLAARRRRVGATGAGLAAAR